MPGRRTKLLLYLADFISTTQTIRGGRVQVVDP
jgi:hypothetical protein